MFTREKHKVYINLSSSLCPLTPQCHRRDFNIKNFILLHIFTEDDHIISKSQHQNILLVLFCVMLKIYYHNIIIFQSVVDIGRNSLYFWIQCLRSFGKPSSGSKRTKSQSLRVSVLLLFEPDDGLKKKTESTSFKNIEKYFYRLSTKIGVF